MSTGEWSGQGWMVTVTDTELVLAQARGSVTISSANVGRLEVRRRWFRWSLHNEGQPLVRLRGITRIEAAALSRALRRLPLAPAIADAVAWYDVVAQLLGGARLSSGGYRPRPLTRWSRPVPSPDFSIVSVRPGANCP